MNTYTTNTIIRQIAINSISGYQKHISPHKGFACAYRLLHGGESCSQYVKNAIAREGLALAIKSSRRRFQACREANDILKTQYYRTTSHEENEENDNLEQKKKQTKAYPPTSSTCLDPVDCCTLNSGNCASGLDCGALDCGNCASGLDCGALDCGNCASGLDCGALDCSVLDCGACFG